MFHTEMSHAGQLHILSNRRMCVGWVMHWDKIKEGSKTGSWRTSFFCPGQPQSLRGTQTCHVSLSLWNIMVRGAQQYTMDHGGQEYFLWAANVE